jgi:hypothetical protein
MPLATRQPEKMTGRQAPMEIPCLLPPATSPSRTGPGPSRPSRDARRGAPGTTSSGLNKATVQRCPPASAGVKCICRATSPGWEGCPAQTPAGIPTDGWDALCACSMRWATETIRVRSTRLLSDKFEDSTNTRPVTAICWSSESCGLCISKRAASRRHSLRTWSAPA